LESLLERKPQETVAAVIPKVPVLHVAQHVKAGGFVFVLAVRDRGLWAIDAVVEKIGVAHFSFNPRTCRRRRRVPSDSHTPPRLRRRTVRSDPVPADSAPAARCTAVCD
jgi:hypothetical protein